MAKVGNTYSSEWFWSKIWHCLEHRARGVRRSLYRQLHDAFGGLNRSSDPSGVMKELIGIRETKAAHRT